MVWVYAALAIVAFLFLIALLARVRFDLQARVPESLHGRLAFSFLWFRREFRLGKSLVPKRRPAKPEASLPLRPLPGQQGFLRVPIPEAFRRFRDHGRRASTKWILDTRVWRILARFGLRSAGRVIRLMHLVFDDLHVASGNALALGRFAAAWSFLGSLFPALSRPVHYDFNPKSFELGFRISGGFTGLGFLVLVGKSLLTFP